MDKRNKKEKNNEEIEKKQREKYKRRDQCDDFLMSDIFLHIRDAPRELVLSHTRRNVKPVNVPAANILRALIRRA